MPFPFTVSSLIVGLALCSGVFPVDENIVSTGYRSTNANALVETVLESNADTMRNVVMEFFVPCVDYADSTWITEVLVNHAATGGTQDEWYIALNDFQKLTEKLSYIIYTVYDGSCTSGYLLTLMNREPMYEETVEQFCETAISDTKNIHLSYEKTSPNTFTLTKFRETVNDSCAVDSTGRFLDSYNFHNVETKFDSTVRYLYINSGGFIDKAWTKPE